MRVSTVSIKDCPSRLYRQLNSLNFRKRGQMRSTLRSARKGFYKDAVAHYIREDNKILAWTLSFRYKTWDSYRSYFYTRRYSRRKGLGSKLAVAVGKYCNQKSSERPLVYPHDVASRKFFGKCINKNNIKLKQCGY